MLLESFDKAVLWAEAKFGKWPAIIKITLLLMLAAGVYVRPAIESTVLGQLYSKMAQDPFGLIPGNNVGFRILTPLISWLLGLRGDLIIITNILIAAVLVGLVFWYFRTRAPRPGDALIAATVMTFSLVTLTSIYYGGYCDSLTYLIVFLMWWFCSRRVLFYLLFFLGLLNRESIAFLVPWFAFLWYRQSPKKGRWLVDQIVGLGITGGVFLAYRELMSSLGEIGYTASYYLDPLLDNPLYWVRYAFPFQILGLFTVFKLLWVFPIVAAIGMWQNGRRHEVYSMLILLTCTSAQLLIVFDSSRMLTLGFMVMIISLQYLFETNAYRFRERAGWLILLNFLVPQLYTAASKIDIMHPTPVNIIRMLFFGKVTW